MQVNRFQRLILHINHFFLCLFACEYKLTIEVQYRNDKKRKKQKLVIDRNSNAKAKERKENSYNYDVSKT